MELKGLIFDFDGLIVDTEGPDFAAWGAIYREHGQTLTLETWALALGTHGGFDPVADLERRTGRRVDRDLLRASRARRAGALIEREPVRPGVRRLIEEARAAGIPLGVASSSERSWVRGHLERLGFGGAFDAIRCRDDVGSPKPDPASYEAVCRALGVLPAEAAALEDSPNGILAAKRAGLFCVAVPNALTRSLPLDGADLQVDSLEEITLAMLADCVAGAHR